MITNKPALINNIFKRLLIKLLRILTYLFVTVDFFFSSIGISEFYNVVIAGRTSAYPWGSVNENPWYYQTSGIYSAYNLVCGLLFLIIALLTFWATVKKSKKWIIASVGLTIFCLLAHLINTNIE